MIQKDRKKQGDSLGIPVCYQKALEPDLCGSKIIICLKNGLIYAIFKVDFGKENRLTFRMKR